MHLAAGHGADLGDAEGLADLGLALVDFLEHRREQAGHGLLDLVGQVVNDRVQADVDLLLLGQRLRPSAPAAR